MTVFLHKYAGVLPAGDIFSFQWHSNSGATIDTSHGNAVTWINDLWNGVGAVSGIKGNFTTGVIVEKVTTTQLDTVFPFRTVFTRETDMSLAGTDGGNSLPQDTSIVISLRSGLSGRKGRGRMYLPAPGAGDLSAVGELAGATIVILNDALAAAWGAVNPAGEQPVVFSRTTGLVQPIQRWGIGTVFDRQKRRVNKVNTIRTFVNMP